MWRFAPPEKRMAYSGGKRTRGIDAGGEDLVHPQVWRTMAAAM